MAGLYQFIQCQLYLYYTPENLHNINNKKWKVNDINSKKMKKSETLNIWWCKNRIANCWSEDCKHRQIKDKNKEA